MSDDVRIEAGLKAANQVDDSEVGFELLATTVRRVIAAIDAADAAQGVVRVPADLARFEIDNYPSMEAEVIDQCAAMKLRPDPVCLLEACEAVLKAGLRDLAQDKIQSAQNSAECGAEPVAWWFNRGQNNETETITRYRSDAEKAEAGEWGDYTITPLYTQPPRLTEVSDAMVEAACVADCGDDWSQMLEDSERTFSVDDGDFLENAKVMSSRNYVRRRMRAALTAALAVR